MACVAVNEVVDDAYYSFSRSIGLGRAGSYTAETSGDGESILEMPATVKVGIPLQVTLFTSGTVRNETGGSISSSLRWLGIEGLPEGAVVHSCSGRDYTQPYPEEPFLPAPRTCAARSNRFRCRCPRTCRGATPSLLEPPLRPRGCPDQAQAGPHDLGRFTAPHSISSLPVELNQQKLSTVLTAHDPPGINSRAVYGYIRTNLARRVEDAKWVAAACSLWCRGVPSAVPG